MLVGHRRSLIRIEREPNDSPLTFRCTNGPEIEPGGEMGIDAPAQSGSRGERRTGGFESASPGSGSVAR